MVTQEITQPLYEEDTSEYLDEIFIRKKYKGIKKGKREYLESIAVLIIGFITLLLINVVYAPFAKTPIFYLSIIALAFAFIIIIEDIKTLVTTNKLKIYSEGISLPRRTFSEWLKGEEHFIPYKDIKEIVIETHYRTGRPLRVKIVKKDGTVETLGASWFLDLDEFKRVIARQGRVEIREVERFVF